jgi:hypothetical protein
MARWPAVQAGRLPPPDRPTSALPSSRALARRTGVRSARSRRLGDRLHRFSLSRQDRSDPTGQAGHLEQGEGQAVLCELVVSPPVELAASGNCAHFIVDLGPPDMTAAMTETDELNDVGWGWLPSLTNLRRSRGGRGRPLRHGLLASLDRRIRGWARVATRAITAWDECVGGECYAPRGTKRRGLSTKLSTILSTRTVRVDSGGLDGGKVPQGYRRSLSIVSGSISTTTDVSLSMQPTIAWRGPRRHSSLP